MTSQYTDRPPTPESKKRTLNIATPLLTIFRNSAGASEHYDNTGELFLKQNSFSHTYSQGIRQTEISCNITHRTVPIYTQVMHNQIITNRQHRPCCGNIRSLISSENTHIHSHSVYNTLCKVPVPRLADPGNHRLHAGKFPIFTVTEHKMFTKFSTTCAMTVYINCYSPANLFLVSLFPRPPPSSHPSAVIPARKEKPPRISPRTVLLFQSRSLRI